MSTGVDVFQKAANIESVAEVTNYVRGIWQRFRFVCKNSYSIGNSTLASQLRFPANTDTLDCKLPTLICAVGLQEAGYQVEMFSRVGGGHPYVLVNVEGLVYRIDFLAEEFSVCKYMRCERLFSWDSICDINHQMKYHMQQHEFSRDGCESLDLNYLALVSEC